MHAGLCERYIVNPHTTSWLGEEARLAVERAGVALLAALGIDRDSARVVWTSGGTEAVNLGCLGVLRGRTDPVCIMDPTGHAALIESCRQGVGTEGHIVTVPVDRAGRYRLDAAPETMLHRARLAAVCDPNNETGATQDLVALRRWLRRCAPDAVLMVDGIQSLGKLEIPWRDAGIDLLAISGRKIGGPASVGALVVRHGVVLEPLLYGGGQQGGTRPGTLDVVGILEFVEAATLTQSRRKVAHAHVTGLNRQTADALRQRFPGICEILSSAGASPYILCAAFPGYEGAVLMRLLAAGGVIVGTGSACSTESAATSHVLAAMGVSERVARGALRISFCASSTTADVDRFIGALARVLAEY